MKGKKPHKTRPNQGFDTENGNGYGSETTDDDVTVVVDEDLESPKDTVKKLREKLKQAQEERREYLEGWQRAKAELVNARKKDEEKLTDKMCRLQEEYVLRLLPVLDSFHLAFSGETEHTDAEWRKGIERILGQFNQILISIGVEEIEAVGKQFDPNFHESVQTVKTERKDEDNIVTQEIQKGYVLGDRVIRATKVCVAHYE